METRSTTEERGDQKQTRQIILTSAAATAAVNWNFLGRCYMKNLKGKPSFAISIPLLFCVKRKTRIKHVLQVISSFRAKFLKCRQKKQQKKNYFNVISLIFRKDKATLMLIEKKTTAFTKDTEIPDESKVHLIGSCWIVAHAGQGCLPLFKKNVTFPHLCSDLVFVKFVHITLSFNA